MGKRGLPKGHKLGPWSEERKAKHKLARWGNKTKNPSVVEESEKAMEVEEPKI